MDQSVYCHDYRNPKQIYHFWQLLTGEESKDNNEEQIERQNGKSQQEGSSSRLEQEMKLSEMKQGRSETTQDGPITKQRPMSCPVPRETSENSKFIQCGKEEEETQVRSDEM